MNATPLHQQLADAALMTEPMIPARLDPLHTMNRLIDVIRSGGTTDEMTLVASRSIFSTGEFSRVLCEAIEAHPETRKLAEIYIVATLDGVLQNAAANVIVKAQRSSKGFA